MSDRNTRGHPDRFEVTPTAQSHFAWLRTRLAVERTLMAWVRTATALIGFGFTIVQFFDSVEYLSYVPPARFPQAPRYLGLALILCGIMALVVSIWEYWWTIGYLWGQDFEKIAGIKKEGAQTPLYTVAISITCVGVFAFFAVLLRLV